MWLARLSVLVLCASFQRLPASAHDSDLLKESTYSRLKLGVSAARSQQTETASLMRDLCDKHVARSLDFRFCRHLDASSKLGRPPISTIIYAGIISSAGSCCGLGLPRLDSHTSILAIGVPELPTASAMPSHLNRYQLPGRAGGVYLLGIYSGPSGVNLARIFIHGMITSGDCGLAPGDLRHGDRLGAAMAWLGSSEDISVGRISRPKALPPGQLLALGLPGAAAAADQSNPSRSTAWRAGRGHGAGAVAIVAIGSGQGSGTVAPEYSPDRAKSAGGHCSSKPMSQCLPANGSSPHGQLQGFWRLEIGGRGGMPAALSQDGGALGASVVLLERTVVGGLPAERSRGPASTGTWTAHTKSTVGNAGSTTLVLAIGAPGLYMGEGAIVLATLVARARTRVPGEPVRSGVLDSWMDFAVASHAVVRAPSFSYSQVPGALLSVSEKPLPPRIVETEGPEGPASADANVPYAIPWGSNIVRGFGAHVMLHGPEPANRSIHATTTLERPNLLLAATAVMHRIPETPPTHCSEYKESGAADAPQGQHVWIEDPTMCLNHVHDSEARVLAACVGPYNGTAADLAGYGTPAAPRTLAGAHMLAELAHGAGSDRVVLGIASERSQSTQVQPFRRLDDWMPQGGGLENDKYPAPLLQLWKGGDHGSELSKIQTSIRYTIQHRQDAPNGPMLEWRKSTNRTSETAAGFCAVPMFASETDLRKGVQPLLSAGNVDVNGLLRRAEAMVQRLRRAKNTLQPGNHSNHHFTVGTDQPNGSVVWSVVEHLVDSLEPVYGDSTGYALPVLGVGTRGGLPPHVWDLLASKYRVSSPSLRESNSKTYPRRLSLFPSATSDLQDPLAPELYERAGSRGALAPRAEARYHPGNNRVDTSLARSVVHLPWYHGDYALDGTGTSSVDRLTIERVDVQLVGRTAANPSMGSPHDGIFRLYDNYTTYGCARLQLWDSQQLHFPGNAGCWPDIPSQLASASPARTEVHLLRAIHRACDDIKQRKASPLCAPCELNSLTRTGGDNERRMLQAEYIEQRSALQHIGTPQSVVMQTSAPGKLPDGRSIGMNASMLLVSTGHLLAADGRLGRSLGGAAGLAGIFGPRLSLSKRDTYVRVQIREPVSWKCTDESEGAPEYSLSSGVDAVSRDHGIWTRIAPRRGQEAVVPRWSRIPMQAGTCASNLVDQSLSTSTYLSSSSGACTLMPANGLQPRIQRVVWDLQSAINRTSIASTVAPSQTSWFSDYHSAELAGTDCVSATVPPRTTSIEQLCHGQWLAESLEISVASSNESTILEISAYSAGILELFVRNWEASAAKWSMRTVSAIKAVFFAADAEQHVSEPFEIDGCTVAGWGEAQSYLQNYSWSLSDFGIDDPPAPGTELFAASFVCSTGALDPESGALRARLTNSSNDVTIAGAVAFVRHGRRNVRTESPGCFGHAVSSASLSLMKQTSPASGAVLSNKSVGYIPELQLVEPRPEQARTAFGQLEEIGGFNAPLPESGTEPVSPAAPAPVVDWTVHLEMSPTGVGCEPSATGFKGRHEGNYAANGGTDRLKVGIPESEWAGRAIRSPGCLRMTAVPDESAFASYQALEAFVIPDGPIALPNGNIMALPVMDVSTTAASSDQLGHPAFETRDQGRRSSQYNGWSLGDFFGAAAVQLPPSLSGFDRAPLSDGSPNSRRSSGGRSTEVRQLAKGQIVSLVRPPPVRVYSQRVIVGAPRAWAATGRIGAIAMVDFAVDLLDRPIVLDARGNEIQVDASYISSYADGVPSLISAADLQARYVVSAGGPVVLVAPGTRDHARNASGGTATSLADATQSGLTGLNYAMQTVLPPGSALGASLLSLGAVPLPGSDKSGAAVHPPPSTCAAVLRLLPFGNQSTSTLALDEIKRKCTQPGLASASRRRFARAGQAHGHFIGHAIAAGAPGAGQQREGAVLLVWLDSQAVEDVPMAEDGKLDPAMMYSRASPGTIMGAVPRVVDWRLIGVAPQLHCGYMPAFCISSETLGLHIPEWAPDVAKDHAIPDATGLLGKTGAVPAGQCGGVPIRIELDSEKRGRAILPRVGMTVDPRPRVADPDAPLLHIGQPVESPIRSTNVTFRTDVRYDEVFVEPVGVIEGEVPSWPLDHVVMVAHEVECTGRTTIGSSFGSSLAFVGDTAGDGGFTLAVAAASYDVLPNPDGAVIGMKSGTQGVIHAVHLRLGGDAQQATMIGVQSMGTLRNVSLQLYKAVRSIRDFKSTSSPDRYVLGHIAGLGVRRYSASPSGFAITIGAISRTMPLPVGAVPSRRYMYPQGIDVFAHVQVADEGDSDPQLPIILTAAEIASHVSRSDPSRSSVSLARNHGDALPEAAELPAPGMSLYTAHSAFGSAIRLQSSNGNDFIGVSPAEAAIALADTRAHFNITVVFRKRDSLNGETFIIRPDIHIQHQAVEAFSILQVSVFGMQCASASIVSVSAELNATLLVLECHGLTPPDSASTLFDEKYTIRVILAASRMISAIGQGGQLPASMRTFAATGQSLVVDDSASPGGLLVAQAESPGMQRALALAGHRSVASLSAWTRANGAAAGCTAKGVNGTRLLFDLERRSFTAWNSESREELVSLATGLETLLESVPSEHAPLVRATLSTPAVFQPMVVSGQAMNGRNGQVTVGRLTSSNGYTSVNVSSGVPSLRYYWHHAAPDSTSHVGSPHVSALVRPGHVLVASAADVPIEVVAVEQTSGSGGAECSAVLRAAATADPKLKPVDPARISSEVLGHATPVHCINGAYVHLGSIPIGRPQRVKVEFLSPAEASAFLDAAGTMVCTLVPLYSVDYSRPDGQEISTPANSAASVVSCFDGALSARSASFESSNDAMILTRAVQAAAAIGTGRVVDSDVPMSLPARGRLAVWYNASANVYLLLPRGDAPVLGPVRFGAVEGAEWLHSVSKKVFGPSISGTSVAIGGAPGFVSAVYGKASEASLAAETPILSTAASRGSAWDGLTRLNAAGGDSLRVDGAGLSLAPAAAGPMLRPNATIEELGCLIGPQHRWMEARTEAGKLVTEWSCLPGQRAAWAASGIPGAVARHLAQVKVGTTDSSNTVKGLIAARAAGQSSPTASPVNALTTGPASRPEWARSALGETTVHIGGSVSPSVSSGTQWRADEARNIISLDPGTGRLPTQVLARLASRDSVHPAPLLVYTPAMVLESVIGMRYSRALSLSAELEYRNIPGSGPATQVNQLVAPVGFVLSIPNSWRVSLPPLATTYAIDPFAMGALKQQDDFLDYEGGEMLEFVGGPAMALLGLGVGSLVEVQSEAHSFIQSDLSGNNWPRLPSDAVSALVELRGRIDGAVGAGTLDRDQVESVGSTGQSLSGLYPALGSTATVRMPLVSLSSGASIVDVNYTHLAVLNETRWPAEEPLPYPVIYTSATASREIQDHILYQRKDIVNDLGVRLPPTHAVVSSAGLMMDARPLRLATGTGDTAPDAADVDVHWYRVLAHVPSAACRSRAHRLSRGVGEFDLGTYVVRVPSRERTRVSCRMQANDEPLWNDVMDVVCAYFKDEVSVTGTGSSLVSQAIDDWNDCYLRQESRQVRNFFRANVRYRFSDYLLFLNGSYDRGSNYGCSESTVIEYDDVTLPHTNMSIAGAQQMWSAAQPRVSPFTLGQPVPQGITDNDCASLALHQTDRSSTSNVYCDLYTLSAVCAVWVPAAATVRAQAPFGAGVDLMVSSAVAKPWERLDTQMLSLAGGQLSPSAGDESMRGFATPLVDARFNEPPVVDAAVALGGAAMSRVPQPLHGVLHTNQRSINMTSSTVTVKLWSPNAQYRVELPEWARGFEGATMWRPRHVVVSPLQREMRPSISFEQPTLRWIDNPASNVDRQRLEPQGDQFVEAAVSNLPPDWLVNSDAYKVIIERSRQNGAEISLMLQDISLQVTNVLSSASGSLVSAGFWENVNPPGISSLRDTACGSGEPCLYIPSLTSSFDSTFASVSALYGGTRSEPNGLRYMQVFVLSVEPAIVLPAAPGSMQYRFEISGEGLQEPGITIEQVVIGPLNCSDSFPVPGQSKKLGCIVDAPQLWDSEIVFFRISSDASEGKITETQKRSFLRPQPPPEVLAVTVAADSRLPKQTGVVPSSDGRVPTTGGLFARVAGLGFGTRDRQVGETGPDRLYNGDVEYVRFGEGENAVSVYHNRFVYADGSVQFWEVSAETGDDGYVLLEMAPPPGADDDVSSLNEQELNNQDGPLIRWSSENNIAVMIPRGVGADAPVSVGMRTGLVSPIGGTSTLSFARPEIVRAFPSVALARDFNVSIVLQGRYFGFRDDHIDSITLGGLPCRSVRQGADLAIVERFGGAAAAADADESVLSGRYITCDGLQPRYESMLSNGTAVWERAADDWPTNEVEVVIAGQTVVSSTVVDLQGAPSVSGISPKTQPELDYDTSGYGTIIVYGYGFGLDARDVVAVVFGPWPEAASGAADDDTSWSTLDGVVDACVEPLIFGRVPLPSPSPSASASVTPTASVSPSAYLNQSIPSNQTLPNVSVSATPWPSPPVPDNSTAVSNRSTGVAGNGTAAGTNSSGPVPPSTNRTLRRLQPVEASSSWRPTSRRYLFDGNSTLNSTLPVAASNGSTDAGTNGTSNSTASLVPSPSPGQNSSTSASTQPSPSTSANPQDSPNSTTNGTTPSIGPTTSPSPTSTPSAAPSASVSPSPSPLPIAARRCAALSSRYAPSTNESGGVIVSAPDSPVQWLSSSRLEVEVPRGAGASIGVAVVLRTGSVAVGELSYSPPQVEIVEPNYLVYGEQRQRLVCGQSLGSQLFIDRVLSFGGVPCTNVEDLDLDAAEYWVDRKGFPELRPRLTSGLIAVSGCIQCNEFGWQDDDLSSLVPWEGNTLQIAVAGYAMQFAGVDLMTPPRVLQLSFYQCSDTLGGNSESAVIIEGLGFGRGPQDVEYVLLSGFDLEAEALQAGFNSTSVEAGSKEGLLNASRLLSVGYKEMMGIPGYVLGVPVPVTDAAAALSTPTGSLMPAVWMSSESIRLELPPGAGSAIQVRVQMAGGVVSRPQQLSYCAPAISPGQPREAILAGDPNASLVLRGRAFPLVLGQASRVRIGGIDCARLEMLEPGRAIRCIGLRWVQPDAAAEDADPDGRGVIGGPWPVSSASIDVLGLASQPSLDAVTLIPPPRVLNVVPEEAGPGETISIRGEGFGAVAADLVNLTIGGVPCTGSALDWFVSSTELACEIPDDHPLWIYVLTNPGAVYPYLGIEVVIRTGVSNLKRYTNDGELVATAPSSAAGAGDEGGILLPPGNYGMDAPDGARLTPKGIAQNFPPPVAPLAPAAWRRVGDDLRLVVRWFFPNQYMERKAVDAISGTKALNFLATQRFRVEAAPSLSAFGTDAAVTAFETRAPESPSGWAPWLQQDFEDEELDRLISLMQAGNTSYLQSNPDRFGIEGELRDLESTLVRLREARQRAVLADNTNGRLNDLSSDAAWYASETTFNVPSGEPYIVRVRAEHVADGIEEKARASEWAYVPWKVVSSCQFGRFRPSSDMGIKQECMLCPEGAVCAGEVATKIAALEGYQRLPWSYGQVGFVRCDYADVCRGVPVSVPAEADASGSAQVHISEPTQLQMAIERTDSAAAAKELVGQSRLLKEVSQLVTTGRVQRNDGTLREDEGTYARARRDRTLASLYPLFEGSGFNLGSNLDETPVLPPWTDRPSEIRRAYPNGTVVSFWLVPPEDTLRLLVAYGWESRPSALAGSRTLAPLELEKCASGHTGVMCQQCEDGFFRNPVGRCLECPSNSGRYAIGRLVSKVFIALLLAAGLGFLLVRAWKQQNEEGEQQTVVAAKILFTHLQTVAIVSSLDVQFPVEMGNFFGGVSVGASAATDGMALECMLSQSSDPVAQTILKYMVLPGLVLFAATVWGLMLFWRYTLAYWRRPDNDKALHAPFMPTLYDAVCCQRSKAWLDHMEKAEEIYYQHSSDADRATAWEEYRMEQGMTRGATQMAWVDACCCSCFGSKRIDLVRGGKDLGARSTASTGGPSTATNPIAAAYHSNRQLPSRPVMKGGHSMSMSNAAKKRMIRSNVRFGGGAAYALAMIQDAEQGRSTKSAAYSAPMSNALRRASASQHQPRRESLHGLPRSPRRASVQRPAADQPATDSVNEKSNGEAISHLPVWYSMVLRVPLLAKKYQWLYRMSLRSNFSTRRNLLYASTAASIRRITNVKSSPDNSDSDSDETADEDVFIKQGVTYQTELVDLLRMWLNRMALSVLVIFFLVHTPMTEAAFRMLSCRSIQPEQGAAFDALVDARREAYEAVNLTVPAPGAPYSEWEAYNESKQVVSDWELFGSTTRDQGQLRLSMNLNYRCSDNFEEMLRVALPMLLGFSLGVPLAVVLLVKGRCCTCVSRETWIAVDNSMSFMFKGLKEERKYWEAVNLLRKAAQALAVTVLAPLGPEVQVLAMLSIVIISLILYTLARPYQHKQRTTKDGLPVVMFDTATGKVVYMKPDDATRGEGLGFDAVELDKYDGVQSNEAEDRAPADGRRRSLSMASGRRGSLARGASSRRLSSHAGSGHAHGQHSSANAEPHKDDATDTRIWNIMPDSMYSGWKSHLWYHLLDAAKSRMPPKPVAPTKAMAGNEKTWIDQKAKFDRDKASYPKRCRECIRKLKKEMHDMHEKKDGARSHAIFETEVLDKPYAGWCCGETLYAFCATMCIACNASVRRYEKARMRDAVREWLYEARIESRAKVKGPGGLARLDRSTMSEDSEGMTAPTMDAEQKSASRGTYEGGRQPSRPSELVRRKTVSHLHLQAIPSRGTGLLRRQDEGNEDGKGCSRSETAARGFVARAPGPGPRLASAAGASAARLPDDGAWDSVASKQSTDVPFDQNDGDQETADLDRDPLDAPFMEDLLEVVDDAINVFPDYSDGEEDDEEEGGDGLKDLVRVLPAVKYYHDDLLNLLDVYSLAVAAATLLAVLAVHVERQIDPLGGYNMSLEFPATMLVIGSNALLLVYAIFSFRKDFKEVAGQGWSVAATAGILIWTYMGAPVCGRLQISCAEIGTCGSYGWMSCCFPSDGPSPGSVDPTSSRSAGLGIVGAMAAGAGIASSTKSLRNQEKQDVTSNPIVMMRKYREADAKAKAAKEKKEEAERAGPKGRSRVARPPYRPPGLSEEEKSRESRPSLGLMRSKRELLIASSKGDPNSLPSASHSELESKANPVAVRASSGRRLSCRRLFEAEDGSQELPTMGGQRGGSYEYKGGEAGSALGTGESGSAAVPESGRFSASTEEGVQDRSRSESRTSDAGTGTARNRSKSKRKRSRGKGKLSKVLNVFEAESEKARKEKQAFEEHKRKAERRKMRMGGGLDDAEEDYAAHGQGRSRAPTDESYTGRCRSESRASGAGTGRSRKGSQATWRPPRGKGRWSAVRGAKSIGILRYHTVFETESEKARKEKEAFEEHKRKAEQRKRSMFGETGAVEESSAGKATGVAATAATNSLTRGTKATDTSEII